MNGYICFYKSKKIEVMADSSYEAQQKAAKQLRVKKAYEIIVCLVEKNGEQVTHSTSEV